MYSNLCNLINIDALYTGFMQIYIRQYIVIDQEE